MELLRDKGVATTITFPMVDADGDAVSGLAGTLDEYIELFSDGNAASSLAATCNNEAAEIGATGVYTLSLDAAETNDEYIYIMIVDSGGSAKTQHILIRTMIGDPANIATTTSGGEIGLASGRVDVGKWLGTGVTKSATTLKPQVDIDSIDDDATAADNAELFFDGTGYAGGSTKLSVSVGAMAADVVTASALNADAVTELLNAMGVVEGAVDDAGATTTDFDTDGFTEASNDHFNGSVMVFTSGALSYQSRTITDYTGAAQNCVFGEAWTEAPAENDTFIIIPGQIAGGDLAKVFRLFVTILNQSTGQLDAGSLTNDTITAASIATDALAADGLAADAKNEIVDQVWDEARADHVGAGSFGEGIKAESLNAQAKLDVNAEADTALSDIKLDHLISAAAAEDEVADNSLIARLAATEGDWSEFNDENHSLEALRVRGDAAWSASATIGDLTRWTALIPPSIDLADTANVRLGIVLTNPLDNLPTTGEIKDTPHITIKRKAYGATTWTIKRNGVNMTEAAGLVYYEEQFGPTNGYAAGDSIEITFADISVTYGGNDQEIADATGITFYTCIRRDPVSLGSGAITFTYTTYEANGTTPLADVTVWVTTDSGGSNVVASGTSDANGEVVFYLDAGTYYFWNQKSGWNFSNPDTEIVSA